MSDTFDYEGSDVQSYFKDMQHSARLGLVGAQDDDPERAARAIELSDATGVPSTAIYGDLDGFERQNKAQLGSSIVADNRYIADYLNSHPMAPRISHDDIGQLDIASRAISDIGGESRLTKWLKADHSLFTQSKTAGESFMEGFGTQPIGSSMVSRPQDLEWVLSHPELGSVALAAATPIEYLSRAIGGMVHLGHDGLETVFGKSFADEAAAMAEWGMMRGDIGVHMGSPFEAVTQNTKLLEGMQSVAKGIELADPWTKLGREPPAGIHPLIDEAKKIQTKEDLDALDAAVKESQKSATRERSPEFYANFARTHLGEREIGVSSEAVRGLYGDKIPEAGDNLLGWVPDLAKKLDAAELTGEDVRIPLADWLANIDPEVHKVLHDDIRVRDNGLTINEGKIGQDIEAKPTTEDWKTVELSPLPKDVADTLADKNVQATPSGNLIRVDPQTGERMRYSEGGVFKPSGEGDIKFGSDKPMKTVADVKATLGYGKKTTGPDIVQQLRGSAGFEPMFAAGDRKITLQRKEPLEQHKEMYAEQNLHDVEILDETGQKIGTINLSLQKDGKQLYIDMISAGSRENKFYQPNYLGPSLIRDLKIQLKQLFPEAETVTGHRVSGAREMAGQKAVFDPKISMPVVKLEESPQGWGFVEPMRDLLKGFWEPQGSFEALRGEKTLEQQHLSAIIERELRRIIPQKLDKVDTPLSMRKPGGFEGQVGGSYRRFLNDFPTIMVALDRGKGAVDVARHEAIHQLRNYGFFKPEEWATLERAAREQGWLDKYGINERYPNLDTPKKLEEAIAEGYRYWAKGNNLGDKVHPIFEKLKQLFEAIKTAYKEFAGKELDWDEIFKKVDTGEVGGREGTKPLEEKGHTPFDMEPKFEQEAEPEADSPGLYDRGKALGVTEAHMQRMLSLIEKRNAEDLEAASRRAELRQRRRSNKDYKERRTTLKEEVRDDLTARPDLAMDALFARQKIKIDPAYLTEDQRARLPKDYIQKKDGVNPDDLAPYFGYPSGDALVERLGILTEDRRRAGMSQRDYFNRLVDVETDRRLNQEFGNREANILDEAKDQALSETQLNLTHEETLAYALKAGAEPQFTKEEVQAMVKQVFDETPVGSISSDRLLQTAGKIGKKIEEAGAKGKWDEAYRLSQQRNHAMIAAKYARDYEKARAQLDRTAKSFRKREVPSVPAEYTNWIHDLLLRVGKPVNRSIQDLQENIGRQSETTLRDFVEAKEAEWMGTRELPVADFLLDPEFRKGLDSLSHRDFMGFKNSIDTLAKAGRDTQKVFREGEAWDREQLISQMREKLATFPYDPKNVEPGKVRGFARTFWAATINTETLMNRFDRADPRGLFNRFIVYPLADAANGKARLQREVAAKYRDIPKPKDLDKLVEAPFPDPMTRTPQNPEGEMGVGWGGGFRRSHVLQMLNHAGNKSNWNVLARGYGADPAELMQWLFKNTTKEDWDRAQQMGKTIFKPLIDKADRVYERMTGATIEKIKIEPIETPFGTYEGWYHPLVADAQRKTVWVQDPDTGIWSQKAQGKRDSIDNEDYFHFSTSNGYTKRRTGAIYPLDLNFSMTPTRIKQMIHDISFREVVHEAAKIFGDRRLREDVSKHYGDAYADGLMPYLRDVAGAEGIPSKGLAKATAISEFLRQNVITTYIGFNPFTVMKHGPTAAIMSSREVGPINFARAVRDLYAQAPGTSRPIHDFIMEHSEEIQRRERNWQDTIAGQGREITGAGNLREKVIEAGSAAVAWSDMVSAKPTWLAAYNKSLADGLSHGESVSLADRAVRRAHGSTAETNQPALVRGGGPLHSWLTSVYGFFGTAMQRRIEMAYKINDAWQLGKEREIAAASKKAGSAFVDFMTYMVWPTIVEEMVTGIGTDDHRGWGAKLISGATMGAASSVLYLRDLIHGAVSGHEPGVGLLSSALHDAANVVRDAQRGREAFNRQHAGKTIGDLLTVAGESTGMMPKIVGNATRYGINVAQGQEKPKSITDVLLGATKGTQKRRVEK